MADELLPSQVVALGDIDVKGIVTQAGSQTSHAAIIARSRGIPAVSGIEGSCDRSARATRSSSMAATAT